MKKNSELTLKKILGKSYVWLVLLFFYFPIIMVVIYSFNNTTSPNSAVWKGFSLRWYQTLFNNSQVGLAVRNSVFIALITVGISIVLGTPAAISMWERKLKINHFLENLSYLAILLPEIIYGIAFLTWFSILKLPFGLYSVAIAHSTFCIPYTIIMVQARLTSLDKSTVEAARTLGAGKIRAFFDVIVPDIVPAILSSSLLSFVLSLDNVIITTFSSGSDGTTLPLKIYSMLKLNPSPVINSLCALMTFVTLLAVVLRYLIDGSKRSKV
jgi:spermidine/putrescine transport system permease protein